MRHLMLIKIRNDGYEKGERPPAPLIAAMDKLMGEWTKAGILVSAGGLLPPSQGALLRLAKGKIAVKDGPFAEAKEVIGGFFVFETESKAHALALTKTFLALHQEVLGKDFECECEVRAMEV